MHSIFLEKNISLRCIYQKRGTFKIVFKIKQILSGILKKITVYLQQLNKMGKPERGYNSKHGSWRVRLLKYQLEK
jgi:hypothetical protein